MDSGGERQAGGSVEDAEAAAADAQIGKGSVVDAILSFIGGTFSPVIPVQNIGYNSTVFPIILGVLFMSVVYRFLQKRMPVYTRTIFVPLITMLVSVPVTLIVLGPIGNTMGVMVLAAVVAFVATYVLGKRALSKEPIA